MEKVRSARTLNGYRLIYKPNHISAMKSANWEGYVYEHIYISEESLGRRLTEEECVHHLNGLREDNRRENLIVILKSEHLKIHAWINKGAPYSGMIRENALNSGKSKSEEPRICIVCQSTIQSKYKKKYCSRLCSKKGQRKVDRPSLTELQDMLSLSNYTAIGRKYNVTGNAVKKWAKKYNLI